MSFFLGYRCRCLDKRKHIWFRVKTICVKHDLSLPWLPAYTIYWQLVLRFFFLYTSTRLRAIDYIVTLIDYVIAIIRNNALHLCILPHTYSFPRPSFSLIIPIYLFLLFFFYCLLHPFPYIFFSLSFASPLHLLYNHCDIVMVSEGSSPVTVI